MQLMCKKRVNSLFLAEFKECKRVYSFGLSFPLSIRLIFFERKICENDEEGLYEFV